MRALSGLTPALARRLQRQLLAHLPPAAATQLRRTLSLHAPAAARPARRSSDPQHPPPIAAADQPCTFEDAAPTTSASMTSPNDNEETPRLRSPDYSSPPSESGAAVGQFCTLPRLRRRSSASQDRTPPEPEPTRGTPDRPLLSKYLTPERALSLDEASLPDGSILSEPSYVAAYGGPRRHSLRLPPDQPRRRVSRFLRSDFFDPPAPTSEESLYTKLRKEKELETQKILREIREKKNRSLDSPSVRSPTSDFAEAPPTYRDDLSHAKKCLSPVSVLAVKDRSRSNTPFFPILDNIKETATDATTSAGKISLYDDVGRSRSKSRLEESSSIRESKLIRPKSYPVKNLDSIDEPSPGNYADSDKKDNDSKEKCLQKESKLMRPKSYPASSPSPEKVYVNRSIHKKEEQIIPKPKDENAKSDIEVSFSITLPRKKVETLNILESSDNADSLKQIVESKLDSNNLINDSLVLKKYKVSNDENKEELENGVLVTNGNIKESISKDITKFDDKNEKSNKEEVKTKSCEGETIEKKGTIKKKIIRKVSSKTKTDLGNSQDTGDAKNTTEKKKVTKKVKEKSENGTKSTATKKKSVLQSIGHKLEKLASTKSSSPEKVSENGNTITDATNITKLKRLQREQSVPVSVEPPTESNLIKRAVTLTDMVALDTPSTNTTKTTVSKVLGLFRKFDPKEKVSKSILEKPQSANIETDLVCENKNDVTVDSIVDTFDKDKPRRPTSLLLNGLGRKNKNGNCASDSVSVASVDNDKTVLKKEIESKNLKNSLKLDFSRLPRVKKIVPTNPVIEPQVINHLSEDKEPIDKNCTVPCGFVIMENVESHSRSRSRSRSTISNSDLKSDLSAEGKSVDKHSLSPSESTLQHLKIREALSPEKEDILDRIRRKSFYSRFNEKKQRRKSNIVGPGAAEYDPLARIHSPPVENRFDASPTSPSTYDLSPGYSIASDQSPSTERYRSLLADLPVNTRNNLRCDNYGLNDKIDMYRSLDRNKFSGNRSFLDYDQPSSYGAQRYARTKSLLDSSDGVEESSLGYLRDPLKYNRTLSMYSPGNYATYRPKRTRNSAIILKESEKEPSPENILEKIKQRKKISISVTRKPDPEKDPLPRSSVSPKGEGNRAECPEKAD